MKIIQDAVACVLKLVGKYDILINQDGKKNRKMVGNTPFTSLHITHCHTTKDYEPERAKKWDDITVCVTLCFGPNENTDHIPAFSIPWKKMLTSKTTESSFIFPKMDQLGLLEIHKNFGYCLFK